MIYLDNAATTPLDPEVLEEMIPLMKNHYGNPSSLHSHGRTAKTFIEKSRKAIATLLNTSPAEIFFTSGGTEGDNTAINGSVLSFSVKHLITSAIEHHAVLHCVENLEKRGLIESHFVQLDQYGHLNYSHLEELLKKYPNALVSLMHANNELGNLNDIYTISALCQQYNAIYHSDTVQTIGHYRHDLSSLNIDFIVGSAHKFHGPKGVGFLYVNGERKINPHLFGGAQERNMRGGTENIYGIVGMAKAMQIAYKEMESHHRHIQSLKSYMKDMLISKVPHVEFNGDTTSDNSLYTILNVSLPPCDINDMLLFNLDIKKISASGGSACSSGSEIGSHVLNSLNADPQRGHIRFSFSKYNTIEEIDYTVEALAEIYRNQG